MKRWYVIQVKHKQEAIATINLRNQNFETYCPIIARSIFYRGYQVHIKEPLFKGYMFVQFDLERDKWRSINGTKGVYKLLTATEDGCSPLPVGFITSLREKEDKSGFIPDEKSSQILQRYIVGKKLKIESGAFAGFTGVCERVKKDRVTILLSLLGGEAIVELPKIIVSPVAS